MKKRIQVLAVTAGMFLAGAVCGAAAKDTAPPAASEEITLAANGQAKVLVALAPDASAPEKTAASALATYLEKVSGAKFAVVQPADAAGKSVLAVGPGAAKAVVPELDLTKAGDKGLDEDGIVLKTVGQCMNRPNSA